MIVLGLILSTSPYMRSAKARFPLITIYSRSLGWWDLCSLLACKIREFKEAFILGKTIANIVLHVIHKIVLTELQ